MEIHQLQSFETVAACGSFTRAAEILCLSQPAVTRQIAALETELRTRLFDRLGRTIRLTAAGEALHGYAEPILRLAREAAEAVGDIEAGGSGRLTVGASSTLATYVLPPLLRRFRETHGPRVEIAIHTGVSARILEMVRAGEADAGLVTGETDAIADAVLTTTVLADYDTCVVVPAGHALAASGGGDPIRAGDLAGNPLILMETGTNLRAYVDRLLSDAGVAEQVSMELDNVEAIKRMIEAGLGVSLLPRVAVQAEVESGRLVALPLAESTPPPTRAARRHIALVYRHDKYRTAALRAFINLLQAEVGTSQPK